MLVQIGHLVASFSAHVHIPMANIADGENLFHYKKLTSTGVLSTSQSFIANFVFCGVFFLAEGDPSLQQMLASDS